MFYFIFYCNFKMLVLILLHFKLLVGNFHLTEAVMKIWRVFHYWKLNNSGFGEGLEATWEAEIRI